MKIRKTQLESWQRYDFWPDRIAKAEEQATWPYCRQVDLDDPDEHACEQCKKDLEELK